MSALASIMPPPHIGIAIGYLFNWQLSMFKFCHGLCHAFHKLCLNIYQCFSYISFYIIEILILLTMSVILHMIYLCAVIVVIKIKIHYACRHYAWKPAFLYRLMINHHIVTVQLFSIKLKDKVCLYPFHYLKLDHFHLNLDWLSF